MKIGAPVQLGSRQAPDARSSMNQFHQSRDVPQAAKVGNS